MAKRKSIGKKARFEVFKRDEFVCQYCGATPPGVVLEIDHILAVSNGGDNDQDNLITSCFNCNRGKAANPLEVIPESLEAKAARVAEAEEQVRHYYKILHSKKDRIEGESWEIAETLSPGCSKKGYSNANRNSIIGFLKRIDFFEVLEAAEITVSKGKNFSYFCGICWSKVRDANG